MGTFTSRLRRTALLGLVVAAASVPGDAQAGLVSRCEPVGLAQVFLPWADPAWYALFPDGGFESGGTGWTLRASAAIADGNEVYSVRAPGDRWSLALAGDDARASSPPVCVGPGRPTIRFFVRNTGAISGALVVTVQFTDPVGVRRTVPVGIVHAGSAWRPTPALVVPTNALTFGRPAVFDFIAHGGDWNVDDVYIDPYAKG